MTPNGPPRNHGDEIANARAAGAADYGAAYAAAYDADYDTYAAHQREAAAGLASLRYKLPEQAEREAVTNRLADYAVYTALAAIAVAILLIVLVPEWTQAVIGIPINIEGEMK